MSAVDELPELPGIDKADGLKRMMNKPALYEKILREFHARLVDAPATIRAALSKGDFETAERHAHSAKGLSGTIGAIELQEAARTLEKSLHEGIHPSATVFEQFERTLATVNQGIALGFGIEASN